MGMSYIKVFFDFEERTEGLTDNEKGRLLLGMLRYAKSGEKPAFSGNERYVWPVLKCEFDRQSAVYLTKVENGRKGGRPRSGAAGEDIEIAQNCTEKTENNRTQTEQNRTETEQNRTAQEEDKEEEKDKEKDKHNERARAEAAFERFWKAYPRKQNRKRALQEWMRIRPDEETVNTILAAVNEQANSDQWTRDGGQYIPHPSSWLHGERWKDAAVRPAALATVPAQRYGQRDYTTEDEDAMQRMVGMA